MRRILFFLILVGMVLAELWPVLGRAEEPLEREAQTAAITQPSGFGNYTPVSGLTDPRGVVPYACGFPSGSFVAERSLNRVSVSTGGPPSPFATGLSSPTDLVAPCGGAFGNFLYVAESGANRISKISPTGVVTTFASLPAVPKRLAFSNMGGGSAFGDFLFVTLANGEVRKIDPAGTVSACASGFTSPEGMVFGPGGSSRTTILYVADATANKISKLDAACTVSAFASAGLTTPTGLAIGQTVRWGPLDTTLYVVNAGTRVDRVDKNGNVTPFASGFTLADSVRFGSFVPNSNHLFDSLSVSDATPGTIVGVFTLRPTVSLLLSGCNPCTAEQTFAVSLTLTNNGPLAVPVELKAGFRLLDATPVNAAPIGKHFEATIPAGFTTGQLLWLSVPWPAVPPGRYCYEASLSDPDLPGMNIYDQKTTCFVSRP